MSMTRGSAQLTEFKQLQSASRRGGRRGGGGVACNLCFTNAAAICLLQKEQLAFPAGLVVSCLLDTQLFFLSFVWRK